MRRMGVKVSAFLLCLMLVVPVAANAAAPNVAGPTSNLRIAWAQLLGENALLTIIAMQKGYDGAADIEAANEAISRNTDSLSAAVGTIYGQSEGDLFKQIWASHTAYLMDYVEATKKSDEAGRDKAAADLESYRMKLAQFFADVNPMFFDKEKVSDMLKMNISHLLIAFDSYANKSYPTVYAEMRMTYTQMFETANALTSGIASQFPDKYPPASADMAASGLRFVLDRMLGEHAILAIVAMQKGSGNAPDLGEAEAALGRNTTDLADAISAVYGEKAGDEFQIIWNSHISYLMDYVKAAAAKDENGRNTAAANLDSYEVKQAEFFADANPNFNSADLEAVLKEHIDQLLKAYDEYVNGSYSAAYGNMQKAHTHMFMTGDLLAAGIAAQFPNKYHQGQPQQPQSQVNITMTLNSRSLVVDRRTTTMDVSPLIQDNRVFIPLRYLAESIGASVGYDKQTKTVWMIDGGDKAVFHLGSSTMELNGVTKKIGTVAFIHAGRLEIPVRLVSEQFGWNVQWNQLDRSVHITKAM